MNGCAQSYKVLVVIQSHEVLDRLENGSWGFQTGVEVSATATARVIRIKVNNGLTGN